VSTNRPAVTAMPINEQRYRSPTLGALLVASEVA
jgi:hypothetical protein